MSRIFWFEQLFCMAFISYTERPISALSLAGEAGAGLIWVDFNFVMSQQAPIRWALNSWAAQANHSHPSCGADLVMLSSLTIKANHEHNDHAWFCFNKPFINRSLKVAYLSLAMVKIIWSFFLGIRN